MPVAITEALAIFKNWNPHWNPTQFKVDIDSAEILALEQVFEGKCTVQYCGVPMF